ncbi:acetyl esterase [Ureibacillus xyleni]|uniref:Acetyl esterase n=1 Tax=Ureibacillus xyleni TaxID=614648 RepID=A0A285TJS8_9BACL|nr:alpha/beta hydrolase [Ureibacillus xyleni]SOC22668.1 acetyl esterase [Ureibacillus xyleni]
MPLHHYIEQYFQNNPQARQLGVPVENPPIDKRPKVLKIEELQVEVDTHQIPIRVYTPEEKPPLPLFIYFHGGEYVQGDLESNDVSCRLICSLSGVKVIAVDYRLASVHPAPAAFHDCYNVTKWVVEHAKQLGGVATNIMIGGASGGGNLATVVALKSIVTGDFQLAKQVLHYPAVDLDEKIKGSEYQSRELYNARYGLDIAAGHASLKHEDLENRNFISPIHADTKLLAQMPQTLIFTAEYDPLCDEGEMYAEKLKEAGVDVKLVRFDGDIHGFMQRFPGSPDYMRGYDITSEFLIG